MPLPRACLLWLLLFSAAAAVEPANLVSNGSFESTSPSGSPADWQASGAQAVEQQLTSDTGRNGGRSARLECTAFEGDGPDHQAMICQIGTVNVRRGQHYRLTFHAKANRIRQGSVDVALTDMRAWRSAGLADTFRPTEQWDRFEFSFDAKTDLPAESSRLQFWFKGTGTLWLDDVQLVESRETARWLPEIPTVGVKNFLPNSSFECGGAGWGGYTWGTRGWTGNLFRLEGTLDAAVAQHGSHSLRIALSPQTFPVLYSDYYEAVREPVRRVLAANRGWLRVTPGEPLTLSAWMRADTDEVPGELAVIEAPDRRAHKSVSIGAHWQRHQFTFIPQQPYLFIAVGADLTDSQRDSATMWIDAVQLERGAQATAYEPRTAVESFVETGVEGNFFTEPAAGASVTVKAFNNSSREQTARGVLSAADFFDREVFKRNIALPVPAHAAKTTEVRKIAAGRKGFLRAAWRTAAGEQSLRCTVMDALPAGSGDSPIGFNHAYPSDFLMRLAQQAGVGWWRDWSAKWNVVEPAQGRFDFRAADEQIGRVTALHGNPLILLPFPSASWNTAARAADVAKAAENSDYLRQRLPFAFAPQEPADFGRYAAETLRRFRRSEAGVPTTLQILNEPVYTNYALPRQFGYSTDDYLRLLETGYKALKAADPNCRVVGGMGANLASPLTREFVEKDGLRWADVLDLHMYDPPRPAEEYDELFRELEDLMRSRGHVKPIWITEYGCYADDDPATQPLSAGDAAMNRSRWPSERAAAEHIVKFTAAAFAHGVRKIFFHAGSTGTINGPDAAGVLFEYGGAPRKMLPAVAALNALLGTPDESAGAVERPDVYAPVFRRGDRFIAVAWSSSGQPRPLHLKNGARAYDVTGNELSGAAAALGGSPVYVVAASFESVAASMADANAESAK